MRPAAVLCPSLCCSACAALIECACRCVDEGRHPDAWTAEAFQRVNRANQLVKGKAEDLKAFS